MAPDWDEAPAAGLNAVREVSGAIRDRLPPGSVLLLYDYDGATLSVWAISGLGIAMEQEEVGREALARSVGALGGAMGIVRAQAERAPVPRRPVALATANPTNAPDKPLSIAIDGASRLLLPRDVSTLLERERPSQIVVVPVLNLGATPFALLRTAGGHGLLDIGSVVIAPGLEDVLDKARRASPVDPGPALVVGDPTYGDADWLLPALPGAAAEAKAVAEIFGAEALLADRATEQRVKSLAPSAGLIHLATHAVADSEEPLTRSFVALAPSGPDDGRWTAGEIQAQRLRAGLVVLSACQTGLGQPQDGGIVGLARAFQLAGAQRVLMSLWNVDDSATARLIGDFLRGLAAGAAAPSALREAALAARARGEGPEVWASFSILTSRLVGSAEDPIR